ncbi:MAG: MOSC and FAD-binding oxidoreductase domain-containing protein [Ginsengibacter sp.]
MKVISINISQPKEVDWHGKKIKTSIFKTPIEGKRHVGKLNIEGDAQSDLQAHGGEHRAVFVYQKDSYDYWKKKLHLEGLRYGQFGENLTVEGLPDNEVCIGDKFQIGTVVLEVTQPRVTCYKVAFSIGVPEMPALLVSHKRPGFYCRVIREGDMEAGDEIVKLSGGKEEMTIVEVDGLLYGNVHPADRLLRALDIEALSGGWRSSFQALYQAAVLGTSSGNAGLAPPATLTAWKGFLPFTVVKIVAESESVRSFGLSPVDNRHLAAFAPGQHIVVKIPTAVSAPLLRMYSLCGPVNNTFYRIGVKAEPNGMGSDYLHHHIREGDRLEISAPRGVFTLAQNARPMILVGAGIGITPLLAMLYAAAAEGKDREVWWIYTTQDKGHYPFRKEVQQITGDLPNYHGQILFTRPQAGDIPGQDFDAEGRLTFDNLKQLNLPGDGDYYLCGPESFMTGVTGALKDLGIPDQAIKQEAFGKLVLAVNGKQPPHVPEGDPGDGPLISFAKSGITFKWHSRFASLLEAAEASDVPANWSCRTGVCHTCETTLFSGEVSYFSAPLDQPASGNVLICCSIPRTDIQLDL